MTNCWHVNPGYSKSVPNHSAAEVGAFPDPLSRHARSASVTMLQMLQMQDLVHVTTSRLLPWPRLWKVMNSRSDDRKGSFSGVLNSDCGMTEARNMPREHMDVWSICFVVAILAAPEMSLEFVVCRNRHCQGTSTIAI